MIELENVSKYYPTDFGRHYVFRNVNLVLPFDKSVGVVGPNGAGKSTFLRLLAGADTPNEGRVIRTGRISPPMGLTPGLLATLTGGENTRFACRVDGMSRDEMDDTVDRVREIADIGKYFDLPVATYSAGMKQRVAFAISMSIHYDYYLFDEIGAGGDRTFRDTSKRMMQERLATSKFIVASHRIDELINLCEAGIVIMDGELHYFDKILDALTFYGEEGESENLLADLKLKSERAELKKLKAELRASLAAGPAEATGSGDNDKLERLRARVERIRQRHAAVPDTASAAPGQDDGVVKAVVPVEAGAAPAAPTREDLHKRRAAQLEARKSAPAVPVFATPERTGPEAEAVQMQQRASERSDRAMRLLLRAVDLSAAGVAPEESGTAAQLAATAQRNAALSCAKARAACEALFGGPAMAIETVAPRAAAAPENPAQRQQRRAEVLQRRAQKMQRRAQQ